ncbi:3-methylitaconate isomerase [Tolypocladium ophioglossoides CBS 100239]|uniref:3-methylitaconate isomerase n=1 Tax=Tolypocladium ophioglossoides (strain CBS 100239) TaxID=1163406 RepID=A0A0L0NEG3_TOLOC|nr:3-methylitaconate isomerase [Tolypocladium ophioglossoides CBS 100239]
MAAMPALRARPWRRLCKPPTPRPRRYSQRSLPAWFVRGGTSNGLVIRREHLPPQELWPTVLPAAMGAPDPQFGRQLDGMGSGVSSTSKVVVLAPPSASHADADVAFTFVQVGIRDGALDLAGNCGNMSSVAGPAAWDLGMIPPGRRVVEEDEQGGKWAVVRVFNTNTSKVVVSRFKVEGEPLAYAPDGDYAMDGVPGTNSAITLSFVDPAGAKTGRALPTGNAVDELALPDGSTVAASLVDVGNPGVFVSTHSLGLDAASLTPASVEANPALKARLEHIRRAGASRMGLDPDTASVPKVVLVFPAGAAPAGVDVRCLAMSMGQAHRAMPLTLALCLGASTHLPGTLAAELLAARGGAGREGTVTIGHPSGRLDVGTEMRDGRIGAARLVRTARVLMKGEVFY